MKRYLIKWATIVWLSICIFASCSDNKDTPIIDGTDTIVIEDFFGLNPADYDDQCRTSTEVYPVKRMDDKFFMMYYASDEEKLKYELAQAGIKSYSIIFEDMDFGALGFDINGSAEKYAGVKSAYVEVNYERAVSSLTSIITAAPFYSCNTGQKWTDMIIFQEFAVVLKDDDDFSKLEQLANAYSVEIVQKITLSEIAYNLFCTNSSKGNALQMANLFYETGLFKEVFVGMQTDFLQFMTENPGIVINTPTIEIEDSTVSTDWGYWAIMDDPLDKNADPIDIDPSNPLVGIKWKLTGVFETETGVLREPEPKNFDNFFGPFECYTLMFINDSVFFSHSSTNKMLGFYKANYENNQIEIDHFGGTKINEFGDGMLWWIIFPKMKSFDLQENELKLYYGENDDYLLFKRQQS
ncbi:MAG: hypothetical protein LBE56_00295 [Tannerella sp.]|jgi:hypothetical protein|nr:hypothetical protein [Tannerella sp.]